MPCFTFENRRTDLAHLPVELKHLFLLMEKTKHVPSKAPGQKCQFDKQTRDLAKSGKFSLLQWHVYNEKYGSTKLVIDHFAKILGLKAANELDPNLDKDAVLRRLADFHRKHEFFPRAEGDHVKGWEQASDDPEVITDLRELPDPSVYRFHFGYPEMGKRQAKDLAELLEQNQRLAQTLEQESSMSKPGGAGTFVPEPGDVVLHRVDVAGRKVYELASVDEVVTQRGRGGVRLSFNLRNSEGYTDTLVPSSRIARITDILAEAQILREKHAIGLEVATIAAPEQILVEEPVSV